MSDTALGRIAAASLPADDTTRSGFRLLPEGPTAFQARIALARQAQKSLDVQYYLSGNDQACLQFLRELRDAAARGVRVRLLVDDLYTAGEDPLLIGLAAFANVELRLFNPLPSRSDSFDWRVLSCAAAQFDGSCAAATAAAAPIRAQFSCAGGKTIEATLFNAEPSHVELTLSDGRRLTLPKAMSGSGARYASADERIVFWNKGDTAFIDEQGRQTYADCRTRR